MKRRNVDCPKLRRPIKKNKITDGIYGSTLVYLKLFFLWAFVLLADFLLSFRFEFLWPFWLLVRSVHDSYKYQGLAFSVFFMSIALTSDMICYFFIPVQWLFFAASTYVWVQYVWHTEKGICLPTVTLWLIFAYMELAVHLRGLRHMPFHLDICRPFAAHCIGYPVVTLGFGFKSYVCFRIRQRRQREVRKENCFYLDLLSQALPVEGDASSTSQPVPPPEKTKVAESNGVSPSGPANYTSNKSAHKKPDKGVELYTNGTLSHEVEYTEKKTANGNACRTSKSSNSNGGGFKMLCFRSRESTSNPPPVIEEELNTPTPPVQPSQTQSQISGKGSGKGGRGGKGKNIKEPDPQHKDEYCYKLEYEMKRLKSELQSSKQSESDLRSQLSSSSTAEKAARAELLTLRHHNEELESKIQSLVSSRATERQNVTSLEKRLSDERRLRCSAEAQLCQERKAKKEAQRECPSETCRQKRRDLETEVKNTKRDLKLKEDICASADRELKSLLQYKESQTGAEMLLKAVTVLKDKNTHLENSLSAETRIKLDLFSALGEAKRQMEIRDSLIRSQEREIEELKTKMAQVLAVMPTADFLALAPASTGGLGLGTMTKFRGLMDSSSSTNRPSGPSPIGSTSNLDPNATVYTPKQGHLTTEA